nr:WbqC family protein [uncultured Undibacterium sp.]
MKLGIMQPYFFPYLGYFQLIAAADVFVLYDNLKYTKKGWINRNRFLQNEHDVTFTLPLASASDHALIVERQIADHFQVEKLRNIFHQAYRRAPFVDPTLKLFDRAMAIEDRNLFRVLHRTLIEICRYLQIPTEIQVASDLLIEHELKGQEKVLAICHHLGATEYINAIGGEQLYAREVFLQQGIALHFLKCLGSPYRQLGNPFIAFLSILDVLMFNSVDVVREKMLLDFELK